jgi:cytochrome b subunit of formate dehydrogenase
MKGKKEHQENPFGLPERGPEEFVRFTVGQRVQHLLVMILFIILLATGFSQRFFQVAISQWFILTMGGIDMVRVVHRTAGVLLTLSTLLHVVGAIRVVLFQRGRPTMFINLQDFRDAILDIRYYAGLSEQRAMCDRFDYRQKFEYWGLVFGNTIVIVTGWILWFPAMVTRFLPGQVVPASHVAHGYEATLALCTIVVWHLYAVIFSPEVFPFDSSIFTGKISRERMIKEHPLEYARLVGIDLERPASPQASTAPAEQAT